MSTENMLLTSGALFHAEQVVNKLLQELDDSNKLGLSCAIEDTHNVLIVKADGYIDVNTRLHRTNNKVIMRPLVNTSGSRIGLEISSSIVDAGGMVSSSYSSVDVQWHGFVTIVPENREELHWENDLIEVMRTVVNEIFRAGDE